MHDFLADALLAVVLEGVVGVGSDLGVGQAAEVGSQRRRQTQVGVGVEDVFQSVGVAVGIAGLVVAVVAGGQHVVVAIFDGGGHQVAEVAAVLLVCRRSRCTALAAPWTRPRC